MLLVTAPVSSFANKIRTQCLTRKHSMASSPTPSLHFSLTRDYRRKVRAEGKRGDHRPEKTRLPVTLAPWRPVDSFPGHTARQFSRERQHSPAVPFKTHRQLVLA